MMTKQIKDSLQMLFMALCLVIGGFTLAACGDDDDDDADGGGGVQTSGLTMDNLVGTWKIMQYKEVEYDKVTGEILDEKNDNTAQDHIVFYADGWLCYYEYSDDRGTWDEEGKSKFIIEKGQPKFFGGDFADVQIVSLSGNEMTLKWKWSSSDSEYKNRLEEITVKLHRESKRTDVLTMDDDDEDVGGGGQTSGLTMDNLVGTWKIMQYKEVEYDKVTGEILDEKNDNTAQDHIVFYADGWLCYYEYSDDRGTWDEEGKSKFIIEKGQPKFFGGDFADVQIVSLSGNEMTLKWKWSSSDSEYKNRLEEITAKLHRETKRTDVLTIGDDRD